MVESHQLERKEELELVARAELALIAAGAVPL